MANGIDVTIDPVNEGGNVSMDLLQLRSLLDIIVVIGDALKGVIPGTVDDRAVDLARYAATKPDVQIFLGKVLDLFGGDPAKIKAIVEKLKVG